MIESVLMQQAVCTVFIGEVSAENIGNGGSLATIMFVVLCQI